MNRRQFMAAGAVTGTAALAGCMGVGIPRGSSEYTGFIFRIRIPDDEDLYEIAQQALSEQRRVTVHYERGLIENPFDAYNNDSVVTDIVLHDETLDDE